MFYPTNNSPYSLLSLFFSEKFFSFWCLERCTVMEVGEKFRHFVAKKIIVDFLQLHALSTQLQRCETFHRCWHGSVNFTLVMALERSSARQITNKIRLRMCTDKMVQTNLFDLNHETTYWGQLIRSWLCENMDWAAAWFWLSKRSHMFRICNLEILVRETLRRYASA